MNFEKFEKYFHSSWHKKIKPFIESEKCDEIYKFLKAESGAGKNLAPLSFNTYRAFLLTPLDELKCVLVGLEPYNKYIEGLPIASGLLLDCSASARVQPELQYFYNGIEKELYNGLKLDYIREYDLSYLAKQGVLLLNSSLTVEEGKPGSHIDVWKPFMNYLFKEIIGPTSVPIIFLGENIDFRLVHHNNPVFMTENLKNDWNTEGVFTKVNRLIDNSNNDTIMFLNIDVPF